MAKPQPKAVPRIPNQQAHAQPAAPPHAPASTEKSVDELAPGESIHVPEELLTVAKQLEQLLQQAQVKLGGADMAVAEAEAKRHENRLAVQAAHAAWIERCTSVCKVLGAESKDNVKSWNLNTEKGTLTRMR